MLRCETNWREQLANLIDAVSIRAHDQMMKRGGTDRMYLIYRPLCDGNWGDLHCISGDEPLPAGWEYANAEHLPSDYDFNSLVSHIDTIARRLPIIGD